MEEKDDDDLKLQRASLEAIVLVKAKIPRLLSTLSDEKRNAVKEAKFRADVKAVVGLLEIFQEEPQLLDPHLTAILPPLLAEFATLVHREQSASVGFSLEGQLGGIAEIIYVLCKVRGEKVITRFMDNQPSYIAPVLDALKRYKLHSLANGNASSEESKASFLSDEYDWKLTYALLLWAGHLILTPFDLTSIAVGSSSVTLIETNISIQDLPNIAKDIIDIALSFLESPTKEQSCASSMLVKLVLRPDMLKIKVVDSLVAWCLRLMSTDEGGHGTIYKHTFVLRVLCGLIQSADAREIGHFFLGIFQGVVQIFSEEKDGLSSIQQESAVARKLSIKILRAITTQTLQLEKTNDANLVKIHEQLMQQMGVLEETIEFMLKRLADPDTQVRHAASKALSIIATKLDEDLAEQVVEAVIGSLGEDVFDEGESKNLSSVNPLKWHGLTLTLSQMLFRRSPSADQLGEILNALYLTLTFEQRSATGNSLGTNVRDASNFGLWSLARRYRTDELLASSAETVESASTANGAAVSRIQSIANHLLCSACLDPSGNVRRGSSAALQELIGRHPDEVKHGISLVQVVDFQAVGLRRRAMVDVAAGAAKLDHLYLGELLDSLFGWRGLQAPDVAARCYAATSLARLGLELQQSEFEACISKITSRLNTTSTSEIEQRHGLVKALSESISHQQSILQTDDAEPGAERSKTVLQLWALFEKELDLPLQKLNLASTRSGLTTASVVSLIAALSSYTFTYHTIAGYRTNLFEEVLVRHVQAASKVLGYTLRSTDAPTLDEIPGACENLCAITPPQTRINLVESWLMELNTESKTRRRPGLMLAVASAWKSLRVHARENMRDNILGLEDRILTILTNIFDDGNIDAKVMAIRCLKLIADTAMKQESNEDFCTSFFKLLSCALNDYTINERGDVGSLVRLEAIDAVRQIGRIRPFMAEKATSDCHLSIQRLALERLDKVRLQAAQCLSVLGTESLSHIESLSDVSTSEYFLKVAVAMLSSLQVTASEVDDNYNDVKKTISQEDRLVSLIEGFASSAGGGSDSLIPTTRAALSSLCDALPLYNTSTLYPQHKPSLRTVGDSLLAALRQNQTNDRVLVPLLETTAFLFDAGIPQRLLVPETPQQASTDVPAVASEKQTYQPFPFRTLLSLVQKSHFKSGALPKLLPCLHIYRHLSAPSFHASTRSDALRKLATSLGHPFPRVRAAAAEALWVVLVTESGPSLSPRNDSDAGVARLATNTVMIDAGGGETTMVGEALKSRDWVSVSAKEGKAFGDELAKSLGVLS